MNLSASPKRLVYVAAAVAIGALAAYGMLSRKAGHNRADDQVRRITVAQFGDFFLYAPLYVATDGDCFRKHGLEANIVNTGGDDKTWAAVLGGSADFGVADPTFVAVSAARGQGGVIVASLVNGVPFWGITFRDIAPLKDANGLAGHSVATFPSPSTAYTLQRKMFSDAGLEPNIKEGGFGAIIPMLKAGGADIGLELEPNVSLAQTEGARIVYSLAERYGDFAITGVTATNSLVGKNPELVAKFREGIQCSLDSLHRDREGAMNILLKRFPGTPADVARKALDRALDDGVIPISATVGRDAWVKAIKLRMEVGDISGDAPYERFVWLPLRGAN